VALSGGGVMGFAVASFGLLGLVHCSISCMAMFLPLNLKNYLICFGIGASLVAFFARVGVVFYQVGRRGRRPCG